MILDTNALSALATRDLTAINRLQSAKTIAVTIISLGEYHFGISQSRYRQELKTWLASFLERAQVLFVDLDTLTHYAAIRRELKNSGTPIPANDCWIAALVRQYRMPIMSKDRHFDQVSDLLRVDW